MAEIQLHLCLYFVSFMLGLLIHSAKLMHFSCDYMVNQSNQRCNAYFFDTVGFLSQVSPTFLQVVALLGGPEIPRKLVLAMLGRWNW